MELYNVIFEKFLPHKVTYGRYWLAFKNKEEFKNIEKRIIKASYKTVTAGLSDEECIKFCLESNPNCIDEKIIEEIKSSNVPSGEKSWLLRRLLSTF